MKVGKTEYLVDPIDGEWGRVEPGYDELWEVTPEHMECLDEIERIRNLHGGLVQCADCEGWFPIGKLNQSSPHQEASPVCDRCLELEDAKSKDALGTKALATAMIERDEARDFARFLWSGYYDGQGIDYDNLEDIETQLPWLGQGGSAVKGD